MGTEFIVVFTDVIVGGFLFDLTSYLRESDRDCNSSPRRLLLCIKLH